MTQNCKYCNNQINQERAEILLDLDLPLSCIKCSKVEAPAVFMNYDHKTAGTLMVVPNNPDGTRNKELVRKANRCFKRSR